MSCWLSFNCCLSSNAINYIHLQTELVPEIGALGKLALSNSDRVALFQDPPFVHYISPITDFERFAHVVIGNHNAYALCLKRPDKSLDFQYRKRIDPCKGLIK